MGSCLTPLHFSEKRKPSIASQSNYSLNYLEGKRNKPYGKYKITTCLKKCIHHLRQQMCTYRPCHAKEIIDVISPWLAPINDFYYSQTSVLFSTCHTGANQFCN